MSWAGIASGLGQGLMLWGKQEQARNEKEAERKWREKISKMKSEEDQFNEALEAVVEAERAKGNDEAALEIERQARYLRNRDEKKAWALLGVQANTIAGSKEEIDKQHSPKAEPVLAKEDDGIDRPGWDAAGKLVSDVVSGAGGLLGVGPEKPEGLEQMRFTRDDFKRTAPNPNQTEGTRDSPITVDPSNKQDATRVASLPDGTYVRNAQTGQLGVIQNGRVVPAG